jgi:hypothetical protein
METTIMDNFYLGNKCYMIFADEDAVMYWIELFDIHWEDAQIACCNGYYNALELCLPE